MLSIVVPWCNRDEIGMALPSLLVCLDAIGGEGVIVNFGGDSTRLLSPIPRDGPHVILVDAGPQRYFNKAKAQNLGASVARSDLLFFCDCDIIIQSDVLAELVATL